MNPFKVLSKFRIMKEEEIKKLVEDAANDANAVLLEKLRGFDEFDSYFRSVNGDFTDRETVFNEKIFNKVKNLSPEIKNILLSSFDSPFSADLNFEELMLIQNAIWNKYVTDPLIQGAVENYVDYVIGSGVNVSSPSEEVNLVFREFEKQNKWFLRQKEIVKNSFIDGEHFTLLFNNNKGDVFVRKCHPSSIESMETAKTDYEVLFSIYRRLAEFDQYGNTTYSDIKQHIKTLDYTMYQNMGLGYNKSTFEPEFKKNIVVDHLKFNDSDKLRGLPPLKRILKWSKLYENFIMDRMVLNHERAKVVWIKTYNQRSREALIDKAYKAPSQGSMLIEKDGIVYRTEKANLDSSEAKEDGLGLLYYIATSVRFPLHILNQRTDQQVYACHSDDTELLTIEGWKNYKEINNDTICGTINPISGVFEWGKIIEKLEYDYDGNLIEFNSKSQNCLVTPNHNLLVKPHNRYDVQDEIKFSDLKKYEAESTPTSRQWMKTSLGKFDNYDEIELPSFINQEDLDDWLKFLAAYIGDGSLWFGSVKNNDIELKRNKISISFIKKRKIDYFFKSLGKFADEIYISDDRGLRSSFYNKELCSWINDNCGKGSYYKKIPKFIYSLPFEKKELFFNSLIQTDGSVDKRIGRTNLRYSTTSKILSDDIMILGLQLGYRSCIDFKQRRSDLRILRGEETTWKSNRYIIKFIIREFELVTDKTLIPYNGKVWCVSVYNGIIVTRRKGKISIHGNSIRKADTPFQKMIESSQFFFAYYFERIYRHVIEQKVIAKKLPYIVKYQSYSEEALLTALKQINDGVLDGRPTENIMNEAKKTLDDGKELVSMKTVEIPISQDFQQMLLEDPKEMAEVLKIHKEIGIASLATLSAKAGYSWKREFPKIMSEFATNLENKKKETEALTPPEKVENKNK